MDHSPPTYRHRNTPLLPIEIISVILLCLPTESLLRFKSVCKLWYQLISHGSHFIAAHLRRSPLQLIIQNPIRPSFVVRNDQGILTVNLDLISNTTQIERTLGITYHGSRGSYVGLFTSCDGLLCFGRRFDGCEWVCNPLLGEWIALPLSQNKPHGRVCGFFFHKASNQYRLLRVSVDYNKSKPPFEFEIFALGTKFWRSLPCSTSHHFFYIAPPAIFKNALHWPIMDGPHILVFRMDDEDLQLIDQPPGVHISPGFSTPSHLMEMEGCLCLGRYHGSNMEVWILKNYYNSNAESWDRRYVFSSETLGIEVQIMHFLNGEIVFAHLCDGLAYYNPVLNSFRTVPHKNINTNSGRKFYWLTVYQKSLISLLNFDKTATNRNISTVTVKAVDDLVDSDDGSDLVMGINY